MTACRASEAQGDHAAFPPGTTRRLRSDMPPTPTQMPARTSVLRVPIVLLPPGEREQPARGPQAAQSAPRQITPHTHRAKENGAAIPSDRVLRIVFGSAGCHVPETPQDARGSGYGAPISDENTSHWMQKATSNPRRQK